MKWHFLELLYTYLLAKVTDNTSTPFLTFFVEAVVIIRVLSPKLVKFRFWSDVLALEAHILIILIIDSAIYMAWRPHIAMIRWSYCWHLFIIKDVCAFSIALVAEEVTTIVPCHLGEGGHGLYTLSKMVFSMLRLINTLVQLLFELILRTINTSINLNLIPMLRLRCLLNLFTVFVFYNWIICINIIYCN